MTTIPPSLLERAAAVRGEFSLARDTLTAGAVSAALSTSTGQIYTGICLDLACGIGFCAEHAAIAAMLQTRETRIDAIVALGPAGIMPPCGRCRELMLQVNADNRHSKIWLSRTQYKSLSTLLPHHWL